MCASTVKGTVEWNDRRITVEGPPEFVSAELDRFRGEAVVHNPADPAAGPSGRPMNDAAFVALKSPKDHYEKIAVLAVRLKEAGKNEFDADEMRRAYLRAGIKPPKVMPQALVDAKRFRDFIEPTSDRGKYRLTNHGSDFVQFELPRKAGLKQ